MDNQNKFVQFLRQLEKDINKDTLYTVNQLNMQCHLNMLQTKINYEILSHKKNCLSENLDECQKSYLILLGLINAILFDLQQELSLQEQEFLLDYLFSDINKELMYKSIIISSNKKTEEHFRKKKEEDTKT